MTKKLKLEELGRIDVETFKRTAKIPLVVILDSVRSMHNVGAIFRTGDAFLIEKVVLAESRLNHLIARFIKPHWVQQRVWIGFMSRILMWL